MHRGDRSSPEAAPPRTRDLQKALQDSRIEVHHVSAATSRSSRQLCSALDDDASRNGRDTRADVRRCGTGSIA